MTNIEEAQRKAGEFLKKALGVKETRVVKAGKVDDGWELEVEVYEESSFIKSLGLPTRVKDRNFYVVKLNAALDVESYEQKGGPKE
ncbi:MAG: gas vesicle protein GvpO [Candidatus Omnitrophota bacterium]